ncbi:penicillin-binding protein 1C [Luteimonas sp. 50]|uniref:peptidoglycan glycosyltransferase n=1 Tax=Cognatiluteimonas sedimenti TaxID=2927791 RepID=A0ABT0A1U1_9GAMM|nr:penicillin-binding protein 1C [Lysobacter sedimenti]MCJ0824942.1 penicillin-binding protein 1C [Lysobacter sedimenti]
MGAARHAARESSGPAPRGWRRLLPWLRWGAAAGLLALLVLDFAFPLPLPETRDTSTLVVAGDGTPLRAFADAQGVWRYPVTPDQVSPLYLQVLLGYEDRWFWRHPGVNPVSLLRAGGQWLLRGHIVSGGSTLTMQVARILERPAGGRRTPLTKSRQILRALQLEAHLSKREILGLYLERAPFGGTIEGVETASRAYLGKPASRLSHAEAALLAVLPQAPSRWRPDRHPQAARVARDKVLDRMSELGIWSPAQVRDAKVEAVVSRTLHAPLSAALLAQRLHGEHPGSARIRSTIDPALQRTLEERVTAYFSELPPRTSAALLVVDNATMEARAYVGSVAFGDKARLGDVDMVRAWRSPGSTLKPFLYGMALDDGLIHSESLLVDAPQSFGGYRPGNFDAAFNGPVGAAQALRLSLNIPAVDLLDRVGPARFSARLDNAGIALKYPRGAKPNLSLILGGSGARLEDLVGAYAALNRGGAAGRVRYTPADPRIDRRVMSPGAAWIVRSVLEANPRPGEREDTFDSRGRPRVAWKTGTSYGFRDAWAIGGTRRHTVGVWVGRPDGTPLPGQYGGVTALPLMFEVIDSLPRRRGDNVPRPPPRNVAETEICWPLGTAAESQPPALCQRRMKAWTLDGVVPPTFAERGARLWNAGRERFELDVATGERVSAACSLPHATRRTEIARWPALASPWLSAAERRASRLPPLAGDCMADGRAAVQELRIEGINDRATLARAPGSEHAVRLSVRALGTDSAVQWLLDGRRIGQSEGASPLAHDFAEAGEHTLTALAQSGAWTSVRFRVLP